MVKSPLGLGSNPGLHLLLKNHKIYPTLSTSSVDYDEVNTKLIVINAALRRLGLVTDMAIRVVEFSNGGYKIRKIFA